MKNLLRGLLPVAIGGWVAASPALAQAPARPGPTAAMLKKNIARLYATTQGDAEPLIGTVAGQLVAYLRTHEVSVAQAKSLGLGYTAAAGTTYFKVFSYMYSSGGTRGTVNTSVFQWKNPAGQLFAYASHEEGGIGEIYQLPSPGRTQYLLLGNEQGSSICVRGIAWLVELKGNYLLLDKKAFDNKPVVDICNVELTYNARRQTLTVAGDSSIDVPDVYAAHLGHPFQPFKLYFSQGRFVRKK